MLLSDYINQVQQLVHDSSSIDYTNADLTLYINEARNRVAEDFWCVRTYFQNLTAIVNQETYPMTGACGGAKVTVGGTYASAPTVTFSPPSSGITATGTAVMSGTAPNLTVVGVAMTTWGTGYSTAGTPSTVTFSAGTVTAQGVPIILNNVIDIYTISYLYPPGLQGFRRAMLQWAPFAHFNAIFRMNTTNGGPPGMWSAIPDQNIFYLFPANPDQNYVLEIDAYTWPNPLVNTTDAETQIPLTCQELVQYQAAYKALLKAQNFDQADYMDKKYDKRALEKNLRRTAPRRPNIYQNVWRRTQRGY